MWTQIAQAAIGHFRHRGVNDVAACLYHQRI